MSIEASALLLAADTSEAHVQREPLCWQARAFLRKPRLRPVRPRPGLLGSATCLRRRSERCFLRRLQPDCNRTGLHWLGHAGTRLDFPAANAVQERTEWDRRRQAGTRLSELQNRDRRFESARRLLPF